MKRPFLFLFAFTTAFGFAQIRFQSLPNPDFIPEAQQATTIVATIAYQGYDEGQAYFGEGEYQIFPDLINGVLDQPIIVLDGFDPGDSRGIGELYASLSFDGDNLADILRAEGYDIVILNAPQYTTDGKDIDGGADYIQRNAMVLAALIDEINSQKVGDAELVILGPSMGGLIARYALAYMEANSLPHETRLYISFDSPHRGANIPISLQYLINYFAQQVGDPDALAIVENVLNSPAAKEMLIDHLLAHLLNGSTYEQDPTKLLPEGAPDFRDAFQTELDNLGFPQEVRNVTMINGSGNGTTTGSPGAVIVDTNLTIDALTDVDVALNFTPAASQTLTVTDVTVYFISIPIDSFAADSESSALTDGVDSAPGGTANIADALGNGGGNPVLEEFIAALQQDTYSFIPTMSALAIDNSDWFATPNLNDSPFVNFYIPSENEDHVTVTAESAQFALDEIRNGGLGITENSEGELFWVQNPAGKTIKFYANNATASTPLKSAIVNLAGQKLMEKTWEPGLQEFLWQHQLASGLYLLQLHQGSYSQVVKLLID
ncbi:MAG TPA: T9SS type A sorting domain-containing protein [Flavobacteriaceae bacterium]|nr:T9SS type A sorting domain-containing protein [Flavobacteriaceae bacterium]MCB9212482.1 T9SS type A sorting domain-containing protein [Alteromonas sp.]HPF10545.1 T9SS type A sorting domain-containing protein [Flavobacteriaceae bacterium]HQU20233.1 T9SS type A sorting domain-containing protein [Flavobacteriaceae bacterium]HQU66025.1 T9SS type A sorting domain-containing protein [Flavobacteriaceae bacterium]